MCKALPALDLTWWHNSTPSDITLWCSVAVWINITANVSLMCLLSGKAILEKQRGFRHQKMIVSWLHHQASSQMLLPKVDLSTVVIYFHNMWTSLISKPGLHEESSFNTFQLCSRAFNCFLQLYTHMQYFLVLSYLLLYLPPNNVARKYRKALWCQVVKGFSCQL